MRAPATTADRTGATPALKIRRCCSRKPWGGPCVSSGCDRKTCSGPRSHPPCTRRSASALDSNGRVLGYQSDHFGPPMQDDRLLGALLAGLPTMGVPTLKAPAPHQGELLVRDPWVYHNVPNVAEVGHGTPQIGQHESPLQAGLRDHSMRTPIQFQQNSPVKWQ